MEKRPLNPDDIFDLTCIGDPQLSPDGNSLAYVKQSLDRDTHKSQTNIFVMDMATGNGKQLTNSGKDSSPRWSPSGDRIAFISSRSGTSQIWIIDLCGGEAWHIPTKEAVQGEPVWCTSSRRIFFTANTFSKPDQWVPYPGSPEGDRQRAEDQAKRALQTKENSENQKDEAGERKKNDIKVITRLRYRMDGIGYYGDLRRQVFYVDVPCTPPASKEPAAVQITGGDFDHGSPAISPDGKFLAVSAFRSGDADYALKQDLWVFGVDTKTPYLLYNAPGPIYNLKWSPNGKWIAFYGHDSARNVSTRTDLYVASVSNFAEKALENGSPEPLGHGQVSNLTGKFDIHAGGFIGSDVRYGGGSSLNWDGETLYFSVTLNGAPYIYTAATDDSGSWIIQQVCGSDTMAISGYSVSGGKIVFQSSTPTEPENLYLAWKTGGDSCSEKQLTFENSSFMSGISVGEWEKFGCNSEDGQELDGWIIYPAGETPSQIRENHSNSKFPLVILVHGGPHGAYGPAFMFNAQLFAGRGYCVAYFNPRGSSSYGQEFMSCIDGDWGNKDYCDIMAGVDAVASKGFVDESNIFIHGWSYGGYMTTWAITQTKRFKAACAGAPVTDLYSDYGTSDIMWSDEHEYGGKPWDGAETLLNSSPLRHVASVETPLLLLHGENDLRCPVLQTEEFYVALKRLGKTAVMVRYPGEFHGLRRPIHRIDRYNRMIAWFEYYRSQG